MDFYTNVTQWGNYLLVRGVDNNQRVNFRVKYKPTLFVPVMKQTDWSTHLIINMLHPTSLIVLKMQKTFC